MASVLRRLALGVLFVVGASAVPDLGPFAGFPLASPAFADDDDGGDDDGGGDDGGGGSGGGNGGGRGGGRDDDRDDGGAFPIFRDLFDRDPPPAAPRRARRAAPQPPRPAYAPAELVAIGSAEDLAAAEGLGFIIIADEEIVLVGSRLARLRVPAGLTLAAARQRLVAARPAVAVDLNHYYRPEAEPGCADDPCLARSLIGWPRDGVLSAATPRIGLIDTGINLAHEALKDRKIDLTSLSDAPRDPSSKVHGTAIAALLVGASGSRTPGLLPAAELVAVDAFHHERGDDRSDAYDLVRALNIVAAKDVDVINLSLAGPDNEVLRRAVAAIAERDLMMVAAAGNDGPNADPIYPAAYPDVTVATAVDRQYRPYRRAGRGEHIDFAAPGVDVWTAASISGARPLTGTSFAAPFVTAAIAHLRAGSPELKRADVKQALAATVEDLGEPGRDPIFGWGLLRLDRLDPAAGSPPVLGVPIEGGVIRPTATGIPLH
ncbi:S8 family serine peptidase [Inquilinus sp. CA228]|uniref:S8 family serine peptidase n=1 Tax=Inquilinus sp. CA228 TaxID=3455609 RepID=UPI003F8D6D7B